MVKIIEYEEKYLEDVKDLLVELEEYIISIDEDHLDQLHPDYRDKYTALDLEEIKNNNGKCYLAVEKDKAIGVIMGIIRKYDENDYLDYKCPKAGVITELVVTQKIRSVGVGQQLMNKMEEFFRSAKCEYVFVDVFGYNDNALKFYFKQGFHARMLNAIKKI